MQKVRVHPPRPTSELSDWPGIGFLAGAPTSLPVGPVLCSSVACSQRPPAQLPAWPGLARMAVSLRLLNASRCQGHMLSGKRHYSLNIAAELTEAAAGAGTCHCQDKSWDLLYLLGNGASDRSASPQRSGSCVPRPLAPKGTSVLSPQGPLKTITRVASMRTTWDLPDLPETLWGSVWAALPSVSPRAGLMQWTGLPCSWSVRVDATSRKGHRRLRLQKHALGGHRDSSHRGGWGEGRPCPSLSV